MNEHVVQHRGRDYVAGLFWQVMSARTGARELRERGQELQFQSVAMRRLPGRLGVGFGNRGKGFSLASLIADRQGPKSVTILELPADAEQEETIYALVAVDEGGLIMPGFDIAGPEAQIRNGLVDLVAMHPISDGDFRLTMPAHFGFGESDSETSLAAFFEQRPRRRELQRARLIVLSTTSLAARRRRLALAAGGLTLLAGCIVGYSWYQHYLDSQAAKRAAAEQARREAEHAAELEAQRQALLAHPWKSEATNLGKACIARILEMPVFVAGWPLTGAECDKDQLILSYARSEGLSTQNFQAARARAFASSAEVAFGERGEEARVRLPEPVAHPQYRDESLPLPQGQLVAFTSVFQRVAQPVNFSRRDEAPVKVLLPGEVPSDDAPTVQLPWNTFDFDFQGGALAMLVARDLDLPGVRIKRVTLSLNALKNGDGVQVERASWHVTGDFYADAKS
ncbi:type 4b pilus protein PilO2 [Salinicola endophyticus]|uniref:Type 4b pilus protein PilO2 n=1 Tax=Salinicola endophyticus TaxID=1949083 RepID=A0AB74UDX6_9GAMM